MDVFDKGNLNPFPEPYVRFPIGVRHTRTAILLHDRGSSGYNLANEIFSIPLDDYGTNLASTLPEWRWVFPTARYLRASGFPEQRRSWFEGHECLEVTHKERLDTGGMQEAVEHILYIIHQEAELLGGACENLLLFGQGQGAAAGLWALLCRRDDDYPLPIRGFVGLDCWLPCAWEVWTFLLSERWVRHLKVLDPLYEDDNYRFVRKMMSSAKEYITAYDPVQGGHCPLFSMPILLLHSTANPVISSLGMIGFTRVWWDKATKEDFFRDREKIHRLLYFFEQRGRFGVIPRSGTSLLDYRRN